MERHGYISNVRDPFERRVDVCEVRPEFLYCNLFWNNNVSCVCLLHDSGNQTHVFCHVQDYIFLLKDVFCEITIS